MKALSYWAVRSWRNQKGGGLLNNIDNVSQVISGGSQAAAMNQLRGLQMATRFRGDQCLGQPSRVPIKAGQDEGWWRHCHGKIYKNTGTKGCAKSSPFAIYLSQQVWWQYPETSTYSTWKATDSQRACKSRLRIHSDSPFQQLQPVQYRQIWHHHPWYPVVSH